MAVGSQVDQSFLAGFQLGQLGPELAVQFVDEVLMFGHRLAKSLFQLASEVLADVEALGVVAGNGFFDLGHRQVRQVAESFLARAAEVVAVTLPVPAGGLGVDEAAGAVLLVTALAEQQALQVVAENAVALAAGRAGVEDLLHLVEEQLRDDGVVPAGNEFPVDLDPAGVVRVGQHGMQLAI